MDDLNKTLGKIFQIIGWPLAFTYVPIMLISLVFSIEPPVFIMVATAICGTGFIIAGSIIGSLSSDVKNGILVIGKIVSLERTGTLVNHQPQVDIAIKFTTNEGEEITASERRIVSLTDLPQVQPDMMVPIRYDPSNPQKIKIDMDSEQADLQDAFNKLMVAEGKASEESINIAKYGVKTKGVILSSKPTGNIINDMGEITFHIKVTRPDYDDTFETTVNKPVPQNMLPSTLPGSVIDVFYLPEDEKNIVIGWKAF